MARSPGPRKCCQNCVPSANLLILSSRISRFSLRLQPYIETKTFAFLNALLLVKARTLFVFPKATALVFSAIFSNLEHVGNDGILLPMTQE